MPCGCNGQPRPLLYTLLPCGATEERFRYPGTKAMPKAPNSFLSPGSMLASGIAGVVTMAVANTLWVTFLLPPRWIALALSFLIGSAAFVGARVPLGLRTVYRIFNFCIIFLVAVASNRVGEAVTAPHDILSYEASSQQTERPKTVQDSALQQLDMGARRRDSDRQRRRPAGADQTGTFRDNSEPSKISQRPVSTSSAKYPRFFSDW